MSARQYQSIVTRLRNRCARHGSEEIYLVKINEDAYVIQSPLWKDRIELNAETRNNLIEAGYFGLERIQGFEEGKTVEKLIVYHYMLYKKYRHKGVLRTLQRLSLFGGILLILISLILYVSDSNTGSEMYFTRSGNHPGYIVLTWFEVLLLGAFLVIASLLFRFWKEKKEE